MPHDTTEILWSLLIGALSISSLLFTIVGFFLKGWYDNVNKHIQESIRPAQEFEALKVVVENLTEVVKELKDEIKEAIKEFRDHMNEHKGT